MELFINRLAGRTAAMFNTESRRDQEEGGELNSQEASPEEIKSREVVLNSQEASPEEIKRREVS